jgi:hypothetical protein
VYNKQPCTSTNSENECEIKRERERETYTHSHTCDGDGKQNKICLDLVRREHPERRSSRRLQQLIVVPAL